MFSQYFDRIPNNWNQYLEKTIWVFEGIDWLLIFLDMIILPVVKINANYTFS
jgi:hypothetical protein